MLLPDWAAGRECAMRDGETDEPGLGRKLAAAGAEVVGEVAKEAATQAVGAAFSFGSFLVLAGMSIVVMIGALAVYIAGWAGTTLILSNVPGVSGFIAPFWGIVALVLLFLGIRWAVRRVGRPIERAAELAVGNIHAAIDARTAPGWRSDAAAATEARPSAAPSPAEPLTLRELDARLAPKALIDPEDPPG